ncbi:M81 family metallopeptidase [Dysgonomonas sp. ZJ709]|uniref:M81 family metallopeptidase n=1 Tax=Dysgonomonas sp. ZJ709 TaxID=2709797 RepID=UPI0013EDC32C|nr:M81 family metallopeptidase [Dysgonomonas sp. ZJ709]
MKKHLFIYTLLGAFITMLCISCKTESKDNRTTRILTLGIRNESNTFSTLPTTEADFKTLRGQDVLKDEPWAEVCRNEGVELIPTLHAYAWPGGIVERTIFEKYKQEILDSIKNAGHLDGIYMDMHGALHVEGYEDAQATLIKEIREIVGNDVLISGSFDLHGNLSPDFVKNINILTAYRTAPHRDGNETQTRAITLLIQAIKEDLKPHIESVIIPILVPGEKSITEVEPLHSIYAQIPDVAKVEGMMDASIFAGYCWADLPRSAMRVFVVAKDEKYADIAKIKVNNLAQQIWDRRTEMKLDVPEGTIDEMIVKAGEYDKTVFISDSGDNTTAGAPGDNTQVLEALIKYNSKDAFVAGIVDNDALRKCVETGIGKDVNVKLGGKVDYIFGKPLQVKGKVIYLSPDSILKTPRAAAVVDIDGIKVAIISTRRSFIEVRDFTEIGLNPLDFKIVVVKLGYLYPELRDIAPVHLMALTSGFCNLDMRTLPFKHVSRPSYPLDLEMNWKTP